MSVAQGGQLDMATAAYGEVKPAQNGALTLVLVDGQRYLGQPGKAGFKVLSFARYRVLLDNQDTGGAEPGGINWSSASLPQLVRQLHGTEMRFAVSELEWRLLWPLALPLLALLAIPLAYSEPRGGGRAAGMLVGILFLLAVNNIVVYVKEHMMNGSMPIFPGLLWVLLLILAVAAYAFFRRSRDLPMLPAWPGRSAS